MSAPCVVHVVGSVDLETGGPARTVPALALAVGAAGASVSLVAQRPRAGSATADLPGRVAFASGHGLIGFRNFRRVLEQEALSQRAEILHDSGIWLGCNHAAASVARRIGVPRIISPRGMLEPWSLQWHRWRKRLAWRLYQRRDLAEARAIHATSCAEAETLRSAGLLQPIIVIPNGVAISAVARVRPERHPRVALFLSRLHPKKGLPDLVEAWSRVRPPGWELWIAGPSEHGHQADIQRRIVVLGLSESVKLLGALYGSQRSEAFERAELFVLPTLSENFGLVVAEALAEGLPVITTTGAPWEALHREQCGWWVEPSVLGLSRALEEACSSSLEHLQAMGRLGHAFARRRLGWGMIGLRMRAAYDALLGTGFSPDIHSGAFMPKECM